MNPSNITQLIYEALSRARMPRPQDGHYVGSHRSARQIMLRVRNEQVRQLGG